MFRAQQFSAMRDRIASLSGLQTANKCWPTRAGQQLVFLNGTETSWEKTLARIETSCICRQPFANVLGHAVVSFTNTPI